MTRKIVTATALLLAAAALTACAPNATVSTPTTTASESADIATPTPSPTPTVRTWTDVEVAESITFEDLNTMLGDYQRPILLLPASGTFLISGIECPMSVDDALGIGIDEEGERIGLSYRTEDDNLNLYVHGVNPGASTPAWFDRCGTGEMFEIRVTP